MVGLHAVLALLSMTQFVVTWAEDGAVKKVPMPAAPGLAGARGTKGMGIPHDDCPISEVPGYCPQPKDCADILALGYTKSGVYTVYVGPHNEPVEVYCDGGWLVFQRRRDGFEDFYRPWDDYANGFGRLYGEFWLGNHFLNLITQQKNYTLRVDLEDFDDNTRWAEYSTFRVGAAHLKYPLTVAGYSGTAGDSMAIQNGQKFSTYDQDNDSWSDNCASSFHGAWWYKLCHFSNLNGKYLGGRHSSKANGVNWKTWLGYFYSLKTTEMNIRPL